MRKDKATVHQLLSFITDNLIEFGKAQVSYGADVITISEPTATGEILGPNHFSEFVIPHVNRITGVLSKLGVKTIVHICGNLRTIVAAVHEACGLNHRLAERSEQVLQLETDCISVDAMVNIRTVKKFKKDLRLMGNVSTFLLEKGSPDKISQTARAIIGHGVDILAPACGLSPMTPIENIRALSNVAP
jgi:[methyl-Co(III) methanol-specific corrinoid protein]:coenzyme M methyltransferase